MADVFTKAKRSAVMARIRGSGNKDTELRLIALMRAAGIRGWRRKATLRLGTGIQRTKLRGHALHDAPRWCEQHRPLGSSDSSGGRSESIVVRPDFVFARQRLAVFVDGCFFHGCPKHATWPKNNAAFWRAKIEGNMARDRLQTRLLRNHGWHVVRIWEHALTAKNAAKTLARLQRALEKGRRK